MKIDQKKSGIVLSYISQGILILSGVIYTPVMLRLLGQSEYGLYQLVFSTVSYMSLLSFGFSASYIRFYSRAKAKNDDNEISRINGMFLLIFVVLSIICCFCGAVMISNIRLIFSGGLSDGEYETARLLMGIMVFSMALTFPNSVFEAVISAHEKFFFQKLIAVIQNILNPFLALPLLIMGYSSTALVCVSAFLTLCRLTVNIWFCIRKLRVRFIFRGFRPRLFREMWGFTFFIFLNQIIDQINWSVDKFLLGRISGTAAVAIYSLGGLINTMYLTFSTSVSGVFIPQVNRIVAESDDNNRLTELFIKVGRIQFMILSVILTGFIFFGKQFMVLWGGEEFSESYLVALFLIVPVTVPLIQNIGIEIQRAKNKHKARSIVYFFIAMGNIFISIPLIKLFGCTGASMGTAISLTAGNIIFMNWYYYKHIGLDIKLFWKNIAGMVRGMIVPCIVGVFIMLFVPIYNWLVLGGYIVLYSLIYLISMYYLGMNDSEKNSLKNGSST